jgi:hypothetical protein
MRRSAHRLVLLVHPYAEPVERGLVDQRRRLGLAPVNCRPKRGEQLVQRRQLHLLRVPRVRLERVQQLGILEVLHAPVAEVRFEDLDPALDRVGAPQVGRLHLTLEIQVEEACDQLRINDLRPPGRGLRARIATLLDLDDEEALPVARLLERLDGPLLPNLHPRDGKVVRRHPISGPAKHHVEPQVLQAPAAVAACPRHLRLMAIRPPSSLLLSLLPRSVALASGCGTGAALRANAGHRRRSSPDPVQHVLAPESPASHAKALRDEQASTSPQEESPAAASGCLRSFQVVIGFAKGAERESVEAVRVADVGAAEGGD